MRALRLTGFTLIGSAAILLVASLGAQVGTAPDAQEFPNFDNAARSLQNTGFEAKRAARALAEAPDDPETARLLANRERPADALAVLRRIVERHPDRIAAAFSRLELYQFQRDASQPHAKNLLALAAQARSSLTGLPREEQARAAYSVIRVENQLDRSQTWASRLGVFLADYGGTEVALLAQVDVINARPLSQARLDALDAFAREHPGTAAAAKATFQKGFDLAHNASALRIEPPRSDPSARFSRVVEAVRELQSGRYPACEWVDRAPELITGFYAYQPRFASPENIDGMMRGYRRYVQRELPRDPLNLPGSSVAYVMTSKLGELHGLRDGDRVAGVEGELAGFERASPRPSSVRLVRAQYYMRQFVELPARRDELAAKARPTLQAIVSEADEPFARRALATLASLHFYERDHAGAVAVYERYLTKYPESDWAWVATLRLGQSQAAMGNAAAAAATFQRLAARENAAHFMRVLGHVFAAESLASLGQVDGAARHAELALSLWDDDHGVVYRSQGYQVRLPGEEPLPPPRDTDVEKAALPARIAELREAASLPGGAALERGRALIKQGRFADARTLLERAGADARGTALGPAARSLEHRAWLEQALALAHIEGAARNDAVAAVELEKLGAEPVDFPVVAARIARATMGAVGSGAIDADALMSSALQAWRATQPLSPTPAPGSVEADVVAVRAAVFMPQGGGIYGKERWNGFEFPVARPAFLVVNPTLSVTLADGSVRRVVLRRPITGLDNVLFIDDEQLALMTTMIRALGGTGRRQPAQIMETPNQPAGRAVDVRAYWNRFFPMRQGHWSGWVFETYPIIRDVTFQNTERTRAAVRVEVGYSGGTVILEKQQGIWRAVDLVNRWVT